MRRLIVLLGTLLAVAVATTAATAEFTPAYASTVVSLDQFERRRLEHGLQLEHRGRTPTAADDVVIDIPVSAPISYAAGTSQINSWRNPLESGTVCISAGQLEIRRHAPVRRHDFVQRGQYRLGGTATDNGAVTAGCHHPSGQRAPRGRCSSTPRCRPRLSQVVLRACRDRLPGWHQRSREPGAASRSSQQFARQQSDDSQLAACRTPAQRRWTSRTATSPRSPTVQPHQRRLGLPGHRHRWSRP